MPRTCPRCATENLDVANYCSGCGAVLALPRADLQNDPWIGRVLFDRYRVVKVLGEGGMSRVYLAEQRVGTVVRKVAVKTLHVDFRAAPEMRTRFQRECETVVQLTHPNTIQFHDFGALEDGTLVVVMEYVEGPSLAEVLLSGPLDPARVDKLVIQIAGSLHEAHARGIVHRDLKPENVLLTDRAGQREFVKVLDFGIAKRVGGGRGTNITQEGMILGTPPYMSPEQFTTQPVDARSDLYSLGVMTYEMLTGRLPFQAAMSWEWATVHLTRAPTPLDAHPQAAALPAWKKAAVMRALSKDRADRQPGVLEFLQEFTGHADAGTAWTMATSQEHLILARQSAVPHALPAAPPPVAPHPSQPPPQPQPFPQPSSHGGQQAPPPVAPEPEAPATWPWFALAVLALALVGVGVYTAARYVTAQDPPPERPTRRAPTRGLVAPRDAGTTLARTDARPRVDAPGDWLSAVHFASAGVAGAARAEGARDNAFAELPGGGFLTLEMAPGTRAMADGGPGADLSVYVDPARPAAYRVEVGSGGGHDTFTVVTGPLRASASVDLDHFGIRGVRLVRIRALTPGAAVHLDAVQVWRLARD